MLSAFQGSNTLPRTGAKNKTNQASSSVDDSEIVITKKLTGGGSSVRIRIGGSARSPTENIQEASDNWVEPPTGSGPGLTASAASAGGGKISSESNTITRGEEHGNTTTLPQVQYWR